MINSNQLGLYLNVLLATIVLATIVFAMPYTASAFYLFQGAVVLEQATKEAKLDPETFQLASLSPQLPVTQMPNSAAVHQAVTVLENAVRWDLNNSRAYVLLINTYLLQGNFQAAKEPLARFSASNSDDRMAHRRLGDVYAMLGESSLAQDEWKKVGLNLHPGSFTLGKGETVRIDAQEMQTDQGRHLQDGGTNVVALFTVGFIGADLFFPKTGEYRLSIRAKNSIPGPVVCEARLDDISIGTVIWGLNDGSYTERNLTFRSGWGARQLRIAYTNDEVSPEGDRNAFFQSFEIQPALAPR